MRQVMAGAFVLCLVGCGSSEKPSSRDYQGPRFTSEENHFSTRALDTWTSARDRGAVVFTDSKWSKNTIAIRAVPIDEGWTEPRTADGVLRATETALHALPGARVEPMVDQARADFRQEEWTLTFTPPGLRGKRYERKHVVLIGSKFIYHVIHTAPAGQLGATALEFEAVVDALREEV